MDNVNEHRVVVNGQEYVFLVFKDLTKPCSQCGIPACGKEDYFWFEAAGHRQTLVLDGGTLDSIIEEHFRRNIKAETYAKLPSFLRESNEHRGWCVADDFNGTQIDIKDLLEALSTMENEKPEERADVLGKEYLIELGKIAVNANEEKSKLFVARS